MVVAIPSKGSMEGNEGADSTTVIDGGLREEIMEQLAQAGETVDDDTTGTADGAVKPQTYTLKDGTEVPLDELEGGYLRQSDYTRKTQELAQQRAEAEQALRLMQALQENPEETLQALARNLQVDNEEDLDPYEAQLRQHEERFAQLEQERFDQELNQTLGTLESQYADRGFQRDEVLQYAIDHEIPNLRAAFLALEEDRATQEGRAARNAQALQAKQSLPPIGGRSRQLGGDAPEFVEVHNIRDAMKNALAELEAKS